MAGNTIELLLEHDIDEQYQYEPGEVLRGIVKVIVKQPKLKVQILKVNLKGEANVSWEKPVPNRPDIIDTFVAKEPYLNINVILLEPDEEDISPVLRAGNHEFPFESQLPYDLPSSFIGRHGSVTYVVKASLQEDRPFVMDSIISSEPFLVLRALNLKQHKELLEPFKTEETKRITDGLWSSGRITAIVSVNRRAHLPGEDIHLSLEVANFSKRAIEAIQASLMLSSTFKAKNQKLSTTQVINRRRDEWEMTKGEGRKWKNTRLTIPPYVPESKLNGCNLIDITYDLLIAIEIAGRNRKNDLHLSIPILVGTEGVGIGYSRQEPDKERTEKFATIKEFATDNQSAKSKMLENELDLPPHMHFSRQPLTPGSERTNPLFGKKPKEVHKPNQNSNLDDEEHIYQSLIEKTRDRHQIRIHSGYARADDNQNKLRKPIPDFDNEEGIDQHIYEPLTLSKEDSDTKL